MLAAGLPVLLLLPALSFSALGRGLGLRCILSRLRFGAEACGLPVYASPPTPFVGVKKVDSYLARLQRQKHNGTCFSLPPRPQSLPLPLLLPFARLAPPPPQSLPYPTLPLANPPPTNPILLIFPQAVSAHGPTSRSAKKHQFCYFPTRQVLPLPLPPPPPKPSPFPMAPEAQKTSIVEKTTPGGCAFPLDTALPLPLPRPTPRHPPQPPLPLPLAEAQKTTNFVFMAPCS